jgi:hypothetical protein
MFVQFLWDPVTHLIFRKLALEHGHDVISADAP